MKNPGTIFVCLFFVQSLQASDVLVRAPGTKWVQAGNDVTMEWEVRQDVDLLSVRIDILLGGTVKVTWPRPNSTEGAPYDQADRFKDYVRSRHTLRFTYMNVESDETGTNFACRFTHSGKEYTNSSATIVVDNAPLVPNITQSPTGPIRQGESVDLQCSSKSISFVAPYSEGLVYTWQRGNARVVPDSKHQFVRDDLLRIRDLDMSDTYTCMVRERRSQLNSQAYVIVDVITTTTVPISTTTARTTKVITKATTAPTTQQEKETIQTTVETISEPPDAAVMPPKPTSSTSGTTAPQSGDQASAQMWILYGVVGLLSLLLVGVVVVWCIRSRGRKKQGVTRMSHVSHLYSPSVSSFSSPGGPPLNNTPTLPKTPCGSTEENGDQGLYWDISDSPCRGELPPVPPEDPDQKTAHVYLLPQMSVDGPQREDIDGMIYKNTKKGPYTFQNPEIKLTAAVGDYLTTQSAQSAETEIKSANEAKPEVNTYSMTPQNSLKRSPNNSPYLDLKA